MQHRSLKIDGGNIAYVRRGQGRPLVLLHGYPLDHRIWDTTAERLDSDFDIVLPDLRGFGDSRAEGADFSMTTYAEDLKDLLNHAGLEQAVVVGHSMGGYIALAFAGAYPDWIAGLGLVASQTAADTPERREGRLATASEVLEAGVGSVAETMATRLCADPDIQVALRDLIMAQRPPGLAGALRAMAGRFDSMEVLRSLKVPVAIVHGQADALIPVERAREMKGAVPSAHYLELAGAGHMPMVEDPERTAAALRNAFQDMTAPEVRGT